MDRMVAHRPDLQKLKATYDKQKGFGPKRAWRMKFASIFCKECEGTKTHIEEEEQTKFKQGTLRSFSRIVQEEGGYQDPGNLIAARNYCMKRLQLGSDWYEFDSFTKRLNFNYIEKGSRETMRNAWQIQKKGVVAPSAPASASLSSGSEWTFNSAEL